MKKNRGIMKGIVLISQLGISMLVPIFLCVFIGQKIDQRLTKNYFTILFLVLGIATAYRNAYLLIKSVYASNKGKRSIDFENPMGTKEKEKKSKVEIEFQKWKETKRK